MTENELERTAATVVAALGAAGACVAVAESCTGGLVAAALTSVAGASQIFPGGIIAYANGIKERQLDVPIAILTSEGAVSESTARAMAEGVRFRFATDWGVATTGIAGPGGATPTKPVGLVFVAVASATESVAERHLFSGSRAEVRQQSVAAALALLLRLLKQAAG